MAINENGQKVLALLGDAGISVIAILRDKTVDPTQLDLKVSIDESVLENEDDGETIITMFNAKEKTTLYISVEDLNGATMDDACITIAYDEDITIMAYRPLGDAVDYDFDVDADDDAHQMIGQSLQKAMLELITGDADDFTEFLLSLMKVAYVNPQTRKVIENYNKL